MKKIFEFLTGPNGESSSKRLIAFSFSVAVIVGSFTGMDNVALGLLIGGVLSILGVQAVTRT